MCICICISFVLFVNVYIHGTFAKIQVKIMEGAVYIYLSSPWTLSGDPACNHEINGRKFLRYQYLELIKSIM
jgi:hypothetical protein